MNLKPGDISARDRDPDLHVGRLVACIEERIRPERPGLLVPRVHLHPAKENVVCEVRFPAIDSDGAHVRLVAVWHEQHFFAPDAVVGVVPAIKPWLRFADDAFFVRKPCLNEVGRVLREWRIEKLVESNGAGADRAGCSPPQLQSCGAFVARNLLEFPDLCFF